MLFDTWGGVLTPAQYEEFSLRHMARGRGRADAQIRRPPGAQHRLHQGRRRLAGKKSRASAAMPSASIGPPTLKDGAPSRRRPRRIAGQSRSVRAVRAARDPARGDSAGARELRRRAPAMCSIWGTASRRTSIRSASRCWWRRCRPTSLDLRNAPRCGGYRGRSHYLTAQLFCFARLIDHFALAGAALRPFCHCAALARSAGRGVAQFVAQGAAQNLADVGLGQLGCENTRASALCSRSVRCGDSAISASAVRCGSFFTTNRATTSPEFSSGCATAATSSTPGCSADDAFDFIRIDVESGHQDHVLLAILDVDETFGVHAADVAGAQPIAEHHVARSHPAGSNSRASPGDRTRRSRRCRSTGNSLPASSRIETSVEGTGSPMEPLKSRPTGLAVAMGEVSVSPQPWLTMLPVTSFQRFGHHRLHRHAAGEADAQRAEIHRFESRRVQQRIEQGVDAADEVELVFLQFRHECREIARIRDQHIAGPERQEGQAIRGERKNVVERQRRYHDATTAGLAARALSMPGPAARWPPCCGG